METFTMADGACSTRGPGVATVMAPLHPPPRDVGRFPSLSYARTGGGDRPRDLHECRGHGGEWQAAPAREPWWPLADSLAGGLHPRGKAGGGRGGTAARGLPARGR